VTPVAAKQPYRIREMRMGNPMFYASKRVNVRTSRPSSCRITMLRCRNNMSKYATDTAKSPTAGSEVEANGF